MLAEKIESVVKTAVQLNQEIVALANQRPTLEAKVREIESQRKTLRLVGRNPDAELQLLNEAKGALDQRSNAKKADARKLVEDARDEFLRAANGELARIIDEQLRPAVEGVERFVAAQLTAEREAEVFDAPLSRLNAAIEHYAEGVSKIPKGASPKQRLLRLPRISETLKVLRAELELLSAKS